MGMVIKSGRKEGSLTESIDSGAENIELKPKKNSVIGRPNGFCIGVPCFIKAGG